MSVTSNIKILQRGQGTLDRVVMPVSTTTVPAVAQGDLMKVSGSDTLLVTSAENADFVGVAETGCDGTTPQDITIMMECVVKAKVVAGSSAAGVFGDLFTWAAGSNGVDWTLTSATSKGLMWSIEAITKGAYGRFLVSIRRLDISIFEVAT